MSRWLVTGAASGIGQALVEAAAPQAQKLWALDVQPQAGQALAERTGSAFIQCDVGSPDDWHQVVSTLQASDDAGLTHVHLNAGIQIAPPDAPLSEYRFEAATLERYRRMMSVNVDGVVFGLQALLPLMSHGGSIVVTASLAGLTPYDVDPLYAMSKHAVVGLVRSLGPTLIERGIRINAFCPAGINTAIIPDAQRGNPDMFMSPEHVAAEILTLMDTPETGKAWVKLREDKAMYIMRAPGDRGD